MTTYQQHMQNVVLDLLAERDRLREALEATHLDSIDLTIADDDFRETAGRRARFYLAPDAGPKDFDADR